ncbi:ubiquitin-conjugating enzyme domain-containing protein [Ditylenchus destructor]|uniref:E2 NEDD8-conjugating enzyme n=1 Tax=Ditylenchus destructor TaxID=166010 RepID=A0AAD4R7T2_9BILA|nr:ubiquitin-conjugating enzyme domain-containing protein [Ditylenchus destructor]
MFNLQKRVQGEDEDQKYLGSRISIRDKLLAQEMTELKTSLADVKDCKLRFPNSSALHEMELTITPNSGLYVGGTFKFTINVPPEYNNAPPTVKCLTRVWHPNINEEGNICLSILRQNSLDGYGWLPTRKIMDVVLGLNALFTDLIDFDDPLNVTAAEEYSKNKEAFGSKVRSYIQMYCKKESSTVSDQASKKVGRR